MNTNLCGALALCAALTFAATTAFAQARMHQVTWAHQEPGSVSHFIVLVSPVEGESENARQVNVGLPQPTPTGQFYIYSAMISFESTEFLAVQAVGHDGLVSAPSSWGSMPPGRPGQPQPVGN